MPLYCRIGRLDIWESSFQDAWIEDGSTLEGLVTDLFELGRFNLYAGFNTEGVNSRLQESVQLLASEGVHVAERLRIEGW
jgi:hypothetical protein